jgi:3-oxoadipate enol-lactonase
MDGTSNLMAHTLERAGCPLHYWVGGPEGRPLVVFTHGLCVDHRSWHYQVPVVVNDYRVLNWDVRGHGLSQPMGQPYDTALAVEDLLALVDRLGYQQAIFVGHSNGTYIHQQLAFQHPERVQALVITDGTCITWPRSAFENWFTRSVTKTMRLFPFETLKRSSLAGDSLKKEVQDYIYDAFSMIPKPEYLLLCERMAECLHAESGYRITQPLLLAHGDQDRLGDIAKIAPEWAAREPNCRYEVIPNARHMAMMDNTERYNQLLLDFLARC